MQPDQATDYVAGIMRRNDVDYSSADDGSHRVIYGSTAIFINFAAYGDDETVVALSGVVLEQLDEGHEAEILGELNRLNQKTYFGKFVLYPGIIKVEYELLATRLQRDEFMTALRTLAELSDNADDTLQESFGGKTWQQADTDAEQQDALDV